MWTKIGFVLCLGALQVLAGPTSVIEAEYLDNLVRDHNSNADTRIVSGWDAKPGQLPWQVNLRMTEADGLMYACGGSVIARQWVLTAAHCTAKKVHLVIRTGAAHFSTPDQIVETELWYNHPNFNSDFPNIVQPDDVALIDLKTPLTYTELTKPIRIQSTTNRAADHSTDILIASGYGRTWTDASTSDTLQWVYLRGVTNEYCRLVFGTIITDSSICAIYYNVTSQSTCSGDSGGPLVLEEAAGQHTLVGVTSFVAGAASGGCHSGHPAGFIRAGFYHDWYQSVTGIDFENLNEGEDGEEDQDEDAEEDKEDDVHKDCEGLILDKLLERLQVDVKVKVSFSPEKEAKEAKE